jgi:hydrogenase expression/formation protein HypE
MADRGSLAGGPVCPSPLQDRERIELGHGSGGRKSAALLRERFLPHFGNPALDRLGDAAVVEVEAGRIAVSTDTFVVHPLEFPGGNIGTLAINGTLNDLAMMGATPRYLTAGFVLEEGLELALLDRILEEMSRAAREAGVPIITGDTKVVERGKADGAFINTTGVGTVDPTFTPSPERAGAGDAVLVSGPIGRHGIAIMAAREGIAFQAEVESDTANLHPLVAVLRAAVGDAVHVLRDPTRGGVASALNEIAAAAKVGVMLEEGRLPVPGPVSAACEMLGFDPLYVANEGILLAVVDEASSGAALEALRSHPLGRAAVRIGSVTGSHPGVVALRTGIGGTRVVDMLPGDQLPRIC